MKTLITILFCSMIILAFAQDAKADDTGDPYSSKDNSTVKAWYDETWQAASFYRTAKGTNQVRYVYTDNPETRDNPTYSTGKPGATISSDMVVIEWKVTGHTHFSSGL